MAALSTGTSSKSAIRSEIVLSPPRAISAPLSFTASACTAGLAAIAGLAAAVGLAAVARVTVLISAAALHEYKRQASTAFGSRDTQGVGISRTPASPCAERS
jgi:hypothetical protein